MEKSSSSYLFDEPSFFNGMARVLDIGGVYDDYNISKTPDEADSKALLIDWLCVGNDIIYAINKQKAI